MKIGDPHKELVEEGTTVMEDVNIKENYVRQFSADAA